MAHVIDDEIYCCIDCLMIIANDDASGMDDDTEKRCRAGIAKVQEKGYLTAGDSDKDEEFSHNRCDVCDALPGSRHHLILLGD